MGISLSQRRKKRPDTLDIPVPGSPGESFTLHRMEITDIISMRTVFDAMKAMQGEDGKVDEKEIAPMIVPLIAKSLGGDWDTDEGRKYLATDIESLRPLMSGLVELHTAGKGETPAEEQAKNG